MTPPVISSPSLQVKVALVTGQVMAVDGGFTAWALGHSIFTEAETLEELRKNVREAADCPFDEDAAAPRIIRLHFVRDEVLTR